MLGAYISCFFWAAGGFEFSVLLLSQPLKLLSCDVSPPCERWERFLRCWGELVWKWQMVISCCLLSYPCLIEGDLRFKTEHFCHVSSFRTYHRDKSDKLQCSCKFCVASVSWMSLKPFKKSFVFFSDEKNPCTPGFQPRWLLSKSGGWAFTFESHPLSSGFISANSMCRPLTGWYPRQSKKSCFWSVLTQMHVGRSLNGAVNWWTAQYSLFSSLTWISVKSPSFSVYFLGWE